MLAAAEAAQDDPAFAADRVGRRGRRSCSSTSSRRGTAATARACASSSAATCWSSGSAGWTTSTPRAGAAACSVVREPAVEYVGLVNRAADEEDRAVVRISAPAGRLGARRPRASGSTRPATTTRGSRSPSTGRWPSTTAAGCSSRSSRTPRAPITSPTRSSPRRGPTAACTTRRSSSRRWPTACPRASRPPTRPASPSPAPRARRRSTCRWPTRASCPTCSRRRCGAPPRRGPRPSTARTPRCERVASPEAIDALLYGSDAQHRTRLVVRGPRIERVVIERVDAQAQPARMTVTDRRPRPALPRGPRHRRGGLRARASARRASRSAGSWPSTVPTTRRGASSA